MATRITLLEGHSRRENITHHCPTCGLVVNFDAWEGVRIPRHYCSTACQSKWVRYALARSYLRQGGDASSFTTVPPAISDS